MLPSIKIFFLPNLSPSLPAVTCSDPAIKEADTITSCKPETDQPKSVTIGEINTLILNEVMYIITMEATIAINGFQFVLSCFMTAILIFQEQHDD